MSPSSLWFEGSAPGMVWCRLVVIRPVGGCLQFAGRVVLHVVTGSRSERRGLKWGTGSAEPHAFVVDGESAVHALMDFDPGPGIAHPAMRREYLETASFEAHHVVMSDSAHVLETEDGGQVEARIHRTIRAPRLRC